jgi:hypothetical protein
MVATSRLWQSLESHPCVQVYYPCDVLENLDDLAPLDNNPAGGGGRCFYGGAFMEVLLEVPVKEFKQSTISFRSVMLVKKWLTFLISTMLAMVFQLTCFVNSVRLKNACSF